MRMIRRKVDWSIEGCVTGCQVVELSSCRVVELLSCRVVEAEEEELEERRLNDGHIAGVLREQAVPWQAELGQATVPGQAAP